jgi:hypothetical protein
MINLRRLELAKHLRETARRLEKGATYRWTHQGQCNCGHLAQTLTGMASGDIHRLAVQSEGEWVDHAAAYCDTTGLPVDTLITTMLSFGLTIDELGDLERLCSPRVTRWLPAAQNYLDYRRRTDVVLYFNTWAAVIEADVVMLETPNATVLVNGKLYTPYEARTEVPLALDENPASGKNAA